MSFFDNIAKLIPYVAVPSRVFSIQRGLLQTPEWLIIEDGIPPGHVSVRRTDIGEWVDWHGYYNKGYPGNSQYDRTGVEHPYTIEMRGFAAFEGVYGP